MAVQEVTTTVQEEMMTLKVEVTKQEEVAMTLKMALQVEIKMEQ